MRARLVVSILTMLLGAFAAPSQGQPADETARPVKARPISLDWETNLDTAMATARQSGKPLLVFFSSKTIPPSTAMRNEVLSKPKLQEVISKHVEMAEIDVDDQADVAGKFKISQLPAFVVLAPNGQELDRFGGFMPPGAFVETLRLASDPRQSIPQLLARIKADPNDMEARWMLARKYARDKNRDGLDKMLIEMRALDPANKQGFLDRVAFLELMTSLNPKMPEEGYAATERFLKEFPNSKMADQVDLARAQMACQMNDVPKGIAIMEAFPQKYPNSKLAARVASDLAAIKAGAGR